jgi:hypothetical protein
MPAPIIKMRAYQREVFRHKIRRLFLLWARQKGKSFLFGCDMLDRMMASPGRLCTIISAAMILGTEVLIKEALLWSKLIETLRAAADKADLKLTTSADGLDLDAICDLFEHSKLETRLWHSRTLYSRSRVIAPNPDTAVGWTGDIYADEVGRWPNAQDVLEAVLPFMAANPDFALRMATTPPPDDRHYTFELFIPPDSAQFPISPKGNWYKSAAGIMVHRVDAWDGHAAGINLYHPDTGAPITPDEDRALAFDKTAWDRNHALHFVAGGTSACSLFTLQSAMAAGTDTCLASEDDLPPDWTRVLGAGKIGIGVDPATTEKKASNPTGLVVIEEEKGRHFARLICRFRSSNPDVHRAIIKDVVAGCTRIRNGQTLRPRRLCIDATNERLFAADLRKELAGIIPVQLVVASEKIRVMGEDLLYKTYLGNLVVNDLNDNLLALPNVRWVKEDFRLVVRSKGGFDNLVDGSGNHGDSFDATKNALLAVGSKSGSPECFAAGVGAFSAHATPHEKNFNRPDHSTDLTGKDQFLAV